MRRRRQAREQVNQTKRIVYISQGVNECGVPAQSTNVSSAMPLDLCNVPLFDNMIERIYGLVLLQALCAAPLVSSKRASELLGKRLVLTELAQDRLMREVRNILCIVERSRRRRALVRPLAMLRLSRKYPYRFERIKLCASNKIGILTF